MDPVVKNQLKQQVKRHFLEFLENFRLKDESGQFEREFYYLEQAKTLVREGKQTLYVKIEHLEQAVGEVRDFLSDGRRIHDF
mmetsp:Transcript_80675/g.224143  ORF Transcript_80675/g.224143 Transcript_80675/m.224143 type:complete len:82 (-) Transcript_80675:106-351(-)